jgi:hypothetical protein
MIESGSRWVTFQVPCAKPRDALQTRRSGQEAILSEARVLRRAQTIRSPIISLTKAIDSKRKESQWQLLVRQLEWENMATEDAVKRYQSMAFDVSERKEGSVLPASRKLIASWFQPLVRHPTLPTATNKLRIETLQGFRVFRDARRFTSPGL